MYFLVKVGCDPGVRSFDHLKDLMDDINEEAEAYDFSGPDFIIEGEKLKLSVVKTELIIKEWGIVSEVDQCSKKS